jgi:hypothetical protein
MNSHIVCLKNKRNNFIRERPIYNPAVSVAEGKGNLHAVCCSLLKQLIRASYKFPSENVFVSINGFMHIGLLLSQRPRKRAEFGCNSLETINR